MAFKGLITIGGLALAAAAIAGASGKIGLVAVLVPSALAALVVILALKGACGSKDGRVDAQTVLALLLGRDQMLRQPGTRIEKAVILTGSTKASRLEEGEERGQGVGIPRQVLIVTDHHELEAR